jgi:hypothetical protein
MVENTLALLLVIKEKDMDYISSEMVENMRVNGKTIFNMEKEFTQIKNKSELKAIGKMEKRLTMPLKPKI